MHFILWSDRTLDHEDGDDWLWTVLATSPLQGPRRLHFEMEQVTLCFAKTPSSLLHLMLLDRRSEGKQRIIEKKKGVKFRPLEWSQTIVRQGRGNTLHPGKCRKRGKLVIFAPEPSSRIKMACFNFPKLPKALSASWMAGLVPPAACF